RPQSCSTRTAGLGRSPRLSRRVAPSSSQEEASPGPSSPSTPSHSRRKESEMPLLRGVARTAVIAGTATAVSNRVSRRQAERWSQEDQGQEQQYHDRAP